MEDADFLRRLQSLTDGEDILGGFDPSSWREFHREEPQDEEDLEAATAADLGQDLSATTPSEDADDENDDNDNDMVDNDMMSAPTYKLNKARQAASMEVAFPLRVIALSAVARKWDETGLAVGEISHDGDTFVPWRLIENYPRLFVGKANGKRAVPLFKLTALLESQVWDLFYLHCPPELEKKPLLFVPTYQFEHFLEVVNAKLDVRFTIPPGTPAERFNIKFGSNGTPRPRFLGRADDRTSFDDLRNSIPAPHPDDDLSKATKQVREEFDNMVEKTRPKSKKEREANRQKRIQARRQWGRSLKRVQRYLGLRQSTNGEGLQDFEHSVVFAAIDIEAFEHNNDMITEIGVAVLDTWHVRDIPPGECGENWFNHIQAYHFRIKEYLWVKNKKYVRGCPENFMFGTSEIVKQYFVISRLRNILNSTAFWDPRDGTTKTRPLVLVFHEASGDINYLKKLSYDVIGENPHLLEVVDTREMHQHLVKSDNATSLGNVLNFLRIEHCYLHNAGNDAVFTLQAMVGLAVVKVAKSLEKQKMRALHGPPQPSDPEAVTGFTSDEDTDGGEAVHPTQPRVPTTNASAGTSQGQGSVHAGQVGHSVLAGW
ncbi:hypothetical protein VTJ49DRAFT_1768 [Mycothermus thermophilus]|uniref:Gfd2/YDR514C-like C-terminal domain-containing protein n=1 Tax=Humicola insolens TaxID=85995 RepID=A0ABR3VP25_HUMIN